jgi:hypothetical protein
MNTWKRSPAIEGMMGLSKKKFLGASDAFCKPALNSFGSNGGSEALF